MKISSNLSNNEYVIHVTNTTQVTINNLALHIKKPISNATALTELIESLIIHRERGSLLFDHLDVNMPIGNLSPNESAKIQFHLKNSTQNLDLAGIFDKLELKSEK
ncbi:MAG: hypothetical protein ATN31_05800 [Candidatus Epulonipiscioides saccharophilum]|nr:MAG: hypothetical protein ATN31_05800 [Epulopiscium sp. AS2M-Bin001]